MPLGVVRRWNVNQAQPSCETSFEGHIDWVNDVLLFHDKLVTCSSDKTVKLWQAGDEGVQLSSQLTSQLQPCGNSSCSSAQASMGAAGNQTLLCRYCNAADS